MCTNATHHSEWNVAAPRWQWPMTGQGLRLVGLGFHDYIRHPDDGLCRQVLVMGMLGTDISWLGFRRQERHRNFASDTNDGGPKAQLGRGAPMLIVNLNPLLLGRIPCIPGSHIELFCRLYIREVRFVELPEVERTNAGSSHEAVHGAYGWT